MLEEYLEKFSELKANDVPAELLYEEYRIRAEHGDRPQLSTYEKRFPAQFPEFQRRLQEMPLATILPHAASQVPTSPISALSSQNPTLARDGAVAETPRPNPALTPRPGITRPSTELLAGTGYKLVKRLGQGSFGEVWLAEAPGGVAAAVKVITRPIDHESAQRELQSLELTKQFRHPFLLQTQQFWTQDERLYIVMELADGSLRDRLKQCRQQGLQGVPTEELLRYIRESAEAIDFLHDKGVLHRDIKPENILILQGHAKVADFGLARGHAAGGSMYSASGCGTPSYMAPEVWRGKAGPHTDQYSLAAAYAELRLDRNLFHGDSIVEVMEKHLNQPPDPKPLPDAEQKVLLKAMSKDPKERYTNCAAFAGALEEALGVSRTSVLDSIPGVAAQGSTSITGSGTVHLKDVPSSKTKRPMMMYGLIAAGVLLLVGAVFGYRFIGAKPETVAVPPPELPSSCEKADGAEAVTVQGRKLWSRIQHPMPDGSKALFILIPKRPGSDDPETFYIMQDKVSAKQFRLFAEKEPKQVHHEEWKKGAADGTGEDLKASDESWPALRVHVDDAHRFARWLHGNLPTTRQWDKAAGAFEDKPRLGPYEQGWDQKDKMGIAIDRLKNGPMKVGEASKDISPFGCRDMSGNGSEWTRNLLRSDRFVGASEADGRDAVLLRGQSYAAEKPLRFKDFKTPESESYDTATPFIAFRVVIEP